MNLFSNSIGDRRSKSRYYQREAVEGAFECWKDFDSTLIQAATGTGKTEMFCEIIRTVYPDPCLIAVPALELLTQAQHRLTSFGYTKEMIDLEANDQVADEQNLQSVMIAMVQSLIAGRPRMRMERFPRDYFKYIIFDEGHHAVANSWIKILDYFTGAKVLYVTATPYRGDKKKLGTRCESVAYEYPILRAIEDGYLVPAKYKQSFIHGLDFSKIDSTAGDLNTGQLGALMEEEGPLHEVAATSIKEIGDRQSIAFCVRVKHAERLAEIYNRPKYGGLGTAEVVHGAMDKIMVRGIFKRFREREFQILVNVGMATEGVDLPEASCIINARPTKSPTLITQINGRSFRPWPGILTGMDLASPEERRQAIAGSPKPYSLILEYTGNPGRHKLCTSLDIFGGNHKPEVMERAMLLVKRSDTAEEPTEIIRRAKEEIEEEDRREQERRKAIVAEANYEMVEFDPDAGAVHSKKHYRPSALTVKQQAALRRAGINPSSMTPGEAKRKLGEIAASRRPSEKQAWVLRKHGLNPEDFVGRNYYNVFKTIDALKQQERAGN